MPDPINFNKHHMQMHGPEISMGGHSWLIEALVLAHVLAVCIFWAWLLCRQQGSGKGRRPPSLRTVGPKPIYVKDDWMDKRSRDLMDAQYRLA